MRHTSATTVIPCELKQGDFPKQSRFLPLNYYFSCFLFFFFLIPRASSSSVNRERPITETVTICSTWIYQPEFRQTLFYSALVFTSFLLIMLPEFKKEINNWPE